MSDTLFKNHSNLRGHHAARSYLPTPAEICADLGRKNLVVACHLLTARDDYLRIHNTGHSMDKGVSQHFPLLLRLKAVTPLPKRKTRSILLYYTCPVPSLGRDAQAPFCHPRNLCARISGSSLHQLRYRTRSTGGQGGAERKDQPVTLNQEPDPFSRHQEDQVIGYPGSRRHETRSI